MLFPKTGQEWTQLLERNRYFSPMNYDVCDSLYWDRAGGDMVYGEKQIIPKQMHTNWEPSEQMGPG